MAIGSIVGIVDLQLDGPARIISRTQGFCELRFLASGATMTQEERRLVPYVLLPGTRVQVGEEAAVFTVAEPPKRLGNGLYVYPCTGIDDDEPKQVCEDTIDGILPQHNPVEQLATVALHDVRQRYGRGTAPLPPEAWGPQTYCAREELLAYRDRCWAGTGGVVALAGSRIQALPHQLLVAHRVLSDRAVRFLLADEVGLGKTIEAGLIIQSLLALRPTMRVLVIAPGALVSQWFLELYVKFGGRQFTMLDSERLDRYEGNPWAEQFVIVSARALEELSGADRIRFAATAWDMVVVDECHRMQPAGVLYKQVATLSKRAPHVLLLSATPGRQHIDAYLALLALLQPDAYAVDDRAGFAAKLQAHEDVLALLERSAEAGAADWPAIKTAWSELLGDDPVLAEHIAESDDDEGRDRLLAYVREHYQLDHRVIGNRRAVLSRLATSTGIGGLSLAERSCEWLQYKANDKELRVREQLDAYRQHLLDTHAPEGPIPPRLAHWMLQLELAAWSHPRVLKRLLAMRMAVLEDPDAAASYRKRVPKGEDLTAVLRTDFSEAEMATHVAISAACYADDPDEEDILVDLEQAVAGWERGTPPRLKALAERIKDFWSEHPQEKVLLFVGQGLAVAPVANTLAEVLKVEVETFGAHQDALGREESARRFRFNDNVPLMVSDPLGGEGRNFQFVSVVVHADLPWSIAAVEQRIGRVDRLGRDGVVPSWVVAAQGDGSVDRAWGQVLDHAVGVFDASASGLEFVAGAIEERALEAFLRGGAAGIDDLLPELTDLVGNERGARDLREERLFNDQERSYREAGEQAAKVDRLHVPVRAACHWLRGMGGHVRRDDEGARAFHLRARQAEDPIDGVFDREMALRNEHLAYFAQGHDLIDRLIGDAAAAEWCRANAWRRAPQVGVKRWEGLRLSLELQLDLAPIASADLPLETLRRVLTKLPLARPLRCYRFDDDGIVREEDETVLAVLKSPFDPSKEDRTLSPRTSREFWLRPLCGGKAEQVLTWQQRVRNAGAMADAEGMAMWEAEGPRHRQALEDALAADRAVLAGMAGNAERRLGDDHPDTLRLREDLEAADQQAEALIACLAGARYGIASCAYVVVA